MNKPYKYYKYEAKIVTEDDIKNKKIPDNSFIFYDNNIYKSENDKMILYDDVQENTMILVKDNIYIWKKNEWVKSNIKPLYDNIKYLCEFNNVNIENLKLDDLECIYRKDIGCQSKLYFRYEETLENITNDLENFKKLEKYLNSKNYKKELENNINTLLNKYYSYINDIDKLKKDLEFLELLI
jgi:hypothetical protein